jgi:magnesium-protoporphyrin O-methyltransferase
MTSPQSSPDAPVDATAPACCRAADPRIARRFDAIAGDWAEADEFPEIVDVSAALLDLIRDAATRRPTVLELGSGTGGLSVALLEMGAASVTGIDLSAASVELAARRADAAGFGARATFRTENAADADSPPHDWVVMDRVICCFGDPDRLVARAAEAARERIGLTAPESRGWRGLVNRPLWAAENLWDLVRGGCRGYVHDLRRIERLLAEAGFVPARTKRVGLWHVGVYERAPNTADNPASRSRGA